jgi:hypothetical protein
LLSTNDPIFVEYGAKILSQIIDSTGDVQVAKCCQGLVIPKILSHFSNLKNNKNVVRALTRLVSTICQTTTTNIPQKLIEKGLLNHLYEIL